MLHGPSFIIMHVPDVERAKTFYADTLGFQVEDEHPGFVQFTNTGGATFALGPEGAGDPVELWWFVEDVDATYRDLAASGVEIISPPKDEPFGRRLAIGDGSGGMLYLLEPAAEQQ